MIRSSDVGSLPLCGDAERFLEGATCFSKYSKGRSREYFAEIVVSGFIDKIEAGVDVPSYPQFRDMNTMFLAMINGVQKVDGGYMETDRLSLRADEDQIPEVAAIRRNSQQIHEKTGGTFKVKVCVTGPYTLSSLFLHRDEEMFRRLGTWVAQIIERNIFTNKHGGVELVTLDEPIFGLQDDPLIDYGSEGRENLRRAWQSIFDKVLSSGAQGCLHLHSTADELFWEVDSLRIIEPHANDPIYRMRKTRDQMELADKCLKASLSTMNFDNLIRNKIVATSKQALNAYATDQKIAEVWQAIKNRRVDPTIFIENVQLMEDRLVQVVSRFGAERIPYAGPECGLKGFPSYACALECLRRISTAVENVNETLA